VTINLNGLEQFLNFGPNGYLFGHLAAVFVLGILCWRQITKAGICFGDSCAKAQEEGGKAYALRMENKGGAHAIKAGIVAILVLANALMVMDMSCSSYEHALKTNIEMVQSE